MVYHLVYDKDKMSIFIMITMAYWVLWRTGEDSAPLIKALSSLILFINIPLFFIQGYRFVLRMMLLKML